MKSILAIFTISVLGAVGCSSQPSLEEAQAELCTNLAVLQQNMASLAAVGQNSTVGQLKDAQAAVSESFQAVKDSVAQVQGIEIDALDQAYQNLDKAVNDISDNDTIADAVASVQPAVADVQAAQEQLYAGASCQ
jgi:hypothetical protein